MKEIKKIYKKDCPRWAWGYPDVIARCKVDPTYFNDCWNAGYYQNQQRYLVACVKRAEPE